MPPIFGKSENDKEAVQRPINWKHITASFLLGFFVGAAALGSLLVIIKIIL